MKKITITALFVMLTFLLFAHANDSETAVTDMLKV